MGKNVYSREVKWAVVKDKLSDELTIKEIMYKHGIKTNYSHQHSTPSVLLYICSEPNLHPLWCRVFAAWMIYGAY